MTIPQTCHQPPAPIRAAVTGLGVVAPGSVGAEAFWNQMVQGRSGIRRITRFDPEPYRSQIAGECDLGEDEMEPHQDRSVQLAVVAADEAVRDAYGDRIAVPPGHRTSVVFGSAVGATLTMVSLFEEVTASGTKGGIQSVASGKRSSEAIFPSEISSVLARRYGAEGGVRMVSTGCTSGIDAIGHATTMIRSGRADRVIVGGTDAPITPISVACFDAIRATSPNNQAPTKASRPFDLNRSGFVLAEGAAALMLESEDVARARGANIYAFIDGYGTRANAFHMTGLEASSTDLADAIAASFAESGLSPSDIDYINAHGSGTAQNDVHETNTFKHVFGSLAKSTPISSIKSMVGHSLGAIGAIEAVASVLAIRHQFLPPTINLDDSDPSCDLDYIPSVGRTADVRHVLSTASGFGGFQSALILSDDPQGNAA